MQDSEKKRFKDRLAACLNVRDFGTILLIAALIAVLLTGLSAGANSGFVLVDFSVNLLFSAAISYSIYLLTVLTGITEQPAGWKKGALLTLTFTAGGLAGTGIAVVVLHLFLEDALRIDDLVELLQFNVFLAIFFGAAVTSYFVLQDKFHRAAAKLAEKEIQEQKLIRLKTDAELEALRAKINPHFLFNTLNSIASLIPQDPEKAEQMVNKLASLFRAILDAGNAEVVTLAQELHTIRVYLEIEKVRFGDRLTFRIDMEKAVAETPVPALLLQPLVENSILHGIAKSSEGGELAIACRAEGEMCCIHLRDTGPGIGNNGTAAGFGLSAVRERLALHYGENYAFEMSAGNGTHILLRIPGKIKHVANNPDR